MSLYRLAKRVWWYPASTGGSIQGGVGVITGPEGSTVVDAGNSPRLARRIQDAMVEAKLPPARRVIYTHHHWDHVWGGCAWPDVEIIGHESGREAIASEAAVPWSHEYLTEQAEADPALAPGLRGRAIAMRDDDFDGFTVVPPTTTFTDRLDLPDGVEVRHVGGRHARDSSVVTVAGTGVIFLGDCFYPPPRHLRGDNDGPDLAMMRGLLAEGHKWYVDAHSEPRRRWRAKLMSR